MEPAITQREPQAAPVTEPVIRRRISTKERRYHFADVRPLYEFLLAHGAPLEYVPGRTASNITTVYLDTIEGTWSAGRSRFKFRCKNYEDPELHWFEIKRRQGLRVEKRRQSIAPGELPNVLTGLRRGAPAARASRAARAAGGRALPPRGVRGARHPGDHRSGSPLPRGWLRHTLDHRAVHRAQARLRRRGETGRATAGVAPALRR